MPPRRVPRNMWVCLAVLSVLSWAWLPAEHIHHHDVAGHRVEYVHRHFEGHAPVHDGVHVEDDDDAPTYLTGPTVTLESVRTFLPDVAALVTRTAAPQPGTASSWPVALVPFAAHDPPWLADVSPRGPPALPCL